MEIVVSVTKVPRGKDTQYYAASSVIGFARPTVDEFVSHNVVVGEDVPTIAKAIGLSFASIKVRVAMGFTGNQTATCAAIPGAALLAPSSGVPQFCCTIDCTLADKQAQMAPFVQQCEQPNPLKTNASTTHSRIWRFGSVLSAMKLSQALRGTASMDPGLGSCTSTAISARKRFPEASAGTTPHRLAATPS